MDTSANNGTEEQSASEARYAVRAGKEHLFFISPETFANFPGVSCFEVVCEDDRIVLLPYRNKLPTLEEIRDEIVARGITEEDVAAEVAAVRAERAKRSSPSLREAMIQARVEAAANGLTPEILESLLNEQD